MWVSNMKLPVLKFPDLRLRKKASPVEQVGDEVRRIVSDMFETMYHEGGIGLAATQVDVHKTILVTNVAEDRNTPLCFINPEVLEREGNVVSEEGCLSIPDCKAQVNRAAHITVKALDQHGRPFTLSAEGIQAICIQHEMDHLNGVLFIDYLSDLKRERLLKRQKQIQREARRETLHRNN